MNRLAILILAALPTSLWAQSSELTPETLKTIRKLGGWIVVDVDPSKWHVELAQMSHDSFEVSSIHQIPRLKRLDLSGMMKVRDGNLLHFPRMKDLRSLNLDGQYLLTEAGLVFLSTLRLTELNLRYTRLTNERLKKARLPSSLQNLNLNNTDISDEGLKHLQRLKNLRHLNLSETKITDNGLKHLQPLKQLEHLDLSETCITGKGLRYLVTLPRLRSLVIKGTKKGFTTFKELGQLIQLEELHLNGLKHGKAIYFAPDPSYSFERELAAIEGRPFVPAKKEPPKPLEPEHLAEVILKPLSKLTNLRALTVYLASTSGPDLRFLLPLKKLQHLALRADEIDQTGMKQIAKLMSLKQLELFCGDLWSDSELEGLHHLKSLPRLELLNVGSACVLRNLKDAASLPIESLTFSKATLSETEWNGLQKMPRLKEITLGELKLNEQSWKQLQKLPHLETLYARDRKITDRDLASLKHLKTLKHLHLSENQITDQGLKHLAEMKQLETLDLSRTCITDEGLKYLRGLKKLRSLHMSYCAMYREKFNMKITNGGVAHLAELTELRELNLNSNPLTDQSLKHLRKLKHLREIRLGQTKVTDEGVVKFGVLFPRVIIDRSYLSQTGVISSPQLPQ